MLRTKIANIGGEKPAIAIRNELREERSEKSFYTQEQITLTPHFSFLTAI